MRDVSSVEGTLAFNTSNENVHRTTLDPPGSIDDLLEDWCKIRGFQLFPNVSDGRRQVFPWDQS